jgi:hypothetical protein
LWTISLITAGIIGAFCFFKIHFHIAEIIHEYYVMNEILPEADKSWTVGARRRTISRSR